MNDTEREGISSLQLNLSHSLYLLGQKPSSLSSFQRYHQLMEKCASQGQFLSFDHHSEWLSCYEKDAQSLHAKMPLCVFRPHTAAHIASFIQECHQLEIPITTRCGGTGLAGSCVPSKGGVVLLTGHLKQIKEHHKGILRIEPGVTVRQINRHVASEGWYFPLSMATEGVAGMAGCLSSHARSYHQQQQSLLEVIDQVLLVDGQGQIHEVPASMVCGAEGLFGVIIEMKIRLKKRPAQCLDFLCIDSWREMLTKLPILRALQGLVALIWWKERFHLRLEGEDWRIPSAVDYLREHLPGIQRITCSMEQSIQDFLPSQRTFIVISSVFHSHQLPEACAWSSEQAHILGLECLQQADVLAGSLHLILQAKGDSYSFHRKAEQFLVLWANFVDIQKGALTSCHGVGMQMRAYMPPFWTEESQQVWRNLQKAFDPKNLFGRERFFPSVGKSLEKARPI